MTLSLLRELVARPSVNPDLLPPGHARAGEAEVADFLVKTAGRAGLETSWQEAASGRRNVVIVLRPKGKARRRIMLAPHMDTVNGTEGQFQPRTVNGRLYGRGACDTKGSMAAMLSAMIGLARDGRRPRETEIVFIGLVDEETGHAGATAVVRAKWKADLAVIGEPTRLKVVTAHKGALWLELRTKGKAAHGSCPERGRNAVHAMAGIVDAMETDYAAALRKRRPHPLLGKGTINVGWIRGGTQPNIVPEGCAIRIDRRTLPGESLRSVRAEIRSILRKRGLRADIVETQALECGPMETDPKLPLVREFFRVAGQRTAMGVTYFCDGAVLRGGGIPCVVFGPGDIAQAHTADEWIEIRSLETATRILTRFLQEQP